MVHRLHTIAGIFVAPLLLIAAFSGFLYALSPTLENVVYQDVLTADSGLPAQPLAEQIARAEAVHPDLELARCRFLMTPPPLPACYSTILLC